MQSIQNSSKVAEVKSIKVP